jgi:tetratricopeptide (TPR) repeat protein
MSKSYFLAAMASLLAGNAAFAQSGLPSDAQLSAWDQKFLPGKYRVEEYDVDSSGKPIPGTARVKAEAQCLSQSDLQSVSRGPVMTAFAWGCQPHPEHTAVDGAMFQMALTCGANKGKSVAGLAAVSISGDGQVVKSSYVKVEIDGKRPDRPTKLFGLGGQMTRVGDCSSAEAGATKTPHQLLADEWERSGKPMAQDLANCLRAIDGGDYATAYARCRATLGLEGMAGTEAEVVLLDKLGLLTGYVHQGEQLGFYRKALAAAERFHGSTSPALVDLLVNTALVVKEKQKAFGEAAALLGRAVELGARSGDKAVQARSVAHHRYWVQALGESGDKPAALVAARRAAQHAEAVLGPRHEDAGSAWTELGLLEWDAGQLEAARASFVKSLAVWEAAKIPAYVRGAKEKIAQVDALMKRRGQP